MKSLPFLFGSFDRNKDFDHHSGRSPVVGICAAGGQAESGSRQDSEGVCVSAVGPGLWPERSASRALRAWRVLHLWGSVAPKLLGAEELCWVPPLLAWAQEEDAWGAAEGGSLA